MCKRHIQTVGECSDTSHKIKLFKEHGRTAATRRIFREDVGRHHAALLHIDSLAPRQPREAQRDH